MKKLLALLLALVMVLSFAACTQTDQPTDPTEPQPTDPPTTDPPAVQETLPEVTVDNPVTYLTISMNIGGNYVSLTAYDNDEGMAHVEYVGAEKKVGDFSLSILHNVAKAVDESGISALNGQSVYTDGNDYASAYVSYADGSYIGADYSGEVPEAFTTVYNSLDAFFQAITASLEVYVPRPVVTGDVNADALSAILDVLDKSGIPNLDGYYIVDVPKDEFFDMTVGLTDSRDVLSGTSCGAMMMTTPYSLIVLEVSKDADMDAITADFAKNIPWNHWVCVSASNAMVARKGNLILFLLGSDSLYAQTASAIQDAGWTNITTYTNPAM